MDINNNPNFNSEDRPAAFSGPIAMLTLGGLFAANAVSLDGPIVAIPDIAVQFNVTASQAQLVTVLFLLGFAAGHIPMGLISDRFGRKPVIITGLVVATITSLVAMTAPTYEILIISRFLQGVATSAAGLLARAMIRDVASGRHASRLNSNALSCLAVLIVIAPILSGYLLQFVGWRGVLFLVFIYVSLLLVLTCFFISETMHSEKHKNHPWQQFRTSFTDFTNSRQSIFASLLGAIAFATYFIFANIGSSMIVDIYGLAASKFGVIFALAAIVQFGAAMTNSRLVERKGSNFVLGIAAIFSVLGITMSLFWFFYDAPPLLAIILIALCFSITHGFILPNSIALTLDPLPKTAGFAAAIHGMLQTGIAAITGFIVSWFYDGRIETILALFIVFGSLTLSIFAVSRQVLVPTN